MTRKGLGMYGLLVRYRAREGAEEQVRDLLGRMIPLTRAEPGCRAYLISQSAEDPRDFVLFERFDDEAAWRAHGEAPYAEEILRGQVWPLLESREREVLLPIEPEGAGG